MLDGLICHCQILVDGPNPITEVHLVLGATGVALLGKNKMMEIRLNFNVGREKKNRENRFILPFPDGQ